MSIAFLIRQFVAAGLTMEQALIAAEVVERNEEAAKAERRANDAERQRRSRMSRHVTDVTVTSVTERDICDSEGVKKEVPPNPLKKKTNIPPSIPTGSQTPRGSRSSGSRLPDDFGLTADLIEYAGSQGLTAEQAAECLAEMREWAFANSNRPVARKADWGLTLQGWMRRKAKDLAREGPRKPFERPNGWDQFFAKKAAS